MDFVLPQIVQDDDVYKSKLQTERSKLLIHSSILKHLYYIILVSNSSSAFLITAFNFLGVIFAFLVYYNYILIQPYIQPLFWAFLWSTAIRPFKSSIILYVETLNTRLDRNEKKESSIPVNLFFRLFYCYYLLFKDLFKYFLSLLSSPFRNEYFSNVFSSLFDNLLSLQSLLWFSILSIIYMIMFDVAKRFLQIFNDYLPITMIIILIFSFLFILIILIPKWSYDTYNMITTVILVIIFVMALCISISFILISMTNELTIAYEYISLFIEQNRDYIDEILNESTLNSVEEILKKFTILNDLKKNLLPYQNLFQSVASASSEQSLFSLFFNVTDASTNGSSIMSSLSSSFSLVNISSLYSTYNISSLYNSSVFSSLSYLSSTVMNSAMWISSFFLTFSYTIVNLGLNLVVFLAAFYYLLLNESSPIKILGELLPFGVHHRRYIVKLLDESIHSIFIYNFKICLLHALVTWLIFRLFGINFAFIAAAFSGIFSIIPYVSSIIICIPAIIYLYYLKEMLKIIIMLVVHISLSWIDPILIGAVKNSHPYWTGLSIVTGLSVLGINGFLLLIFLNMNSFIIGPLCFILSKTIYDLWSSYTPGVKQPFTETPRSVKTKERSESVTKPSTARLSRLSTSTSHYRTMNPPKVLHKKQKDESIDNLIDELSDIPPPPVYHKLLPSPYQGASNQNLKDIPDLENFEINEGKDNKVNQYRTL